MPAPDKQAVAAAVRQATAAAAAPSPGQAVGDLAGSPPSAPVEAGDPAGAGEPLAPPGALPERAGPAGPAPEPEPDPLPARGSSVSGQPGPPAGPVPDERSEAPPGGPSPARAQAPVVWPPPEDQGPAAADAAPPASDERVEKVPVRSGARALGSSNRTMLGQPVPKLPAGTRPDADDAPAERPSDRPVAEASSPEPTQRAPASVPPGPRERAPVVYPDASAHEQPSDEVSVQLPVTRTSSVAKAILVVGAVALAISLGALAYTALRPRSDLRASVVQGEAGELLQIEVPGAVEGTRLRFHGTELPLEAGRAQFPLRAEDLALGDNELTVDVLAPDGSVSSETLELHLELRVRADLGPLAGSAPAFDVVVEAPAGSTATLDGEPLELDASGRGTRRFPIEASQADAEGRVERVVRYRVLPPAGEAAQGEVRTRVPITALRIDRPGNDLVTDAATIEVAGAVAPGATVTIAGANVEVRENRFVVQHPLPEVGEHTIEVVARAPNKAPNLTRIRVRRVADLAAEAARFEVEADLTYARIQQNPALYQGRRVAFEGEVFNVDVREGRSIIQMLVSACTAGQRCPLWVMYPAATDVSRGQRVRVLGVVAGEQQYRSQSSNEVRRDPRLDATFVLPAPPAARRRR